MENSYQVFILIDKKGRILQCDGGYTTPADLTDWILIDEGAGDKYNLCQTHYFPDGLYTTDGIPLYRWDGEQAVQRTEEEIKADGIPPLETVQADKLAELSAACNAAITAGCAVTLSDGSSGRIALTAEDQINLTNAAASVGGGAAAYPYHLDGQLCALYPAADITAMAQAATAHKLYHTTRRSHLAAWVRRCETAAEVSAITYGAELPEDLAAHMAAVLSAMGGDAGVV